MNATRKEIGFREFVTLMASLTAMVALSIDAMLPALKAIGDELNAANPNDPQLVIGLFFIGMAVAQLVYGPLSDSFGRKPSIYLGMAIYLAGSALNYQRRDVTQEHANIMEAALAGKADLASEHLLSHYRQTGAFLAGLLDEAALN